MPVATARALTDVEDLLGLHRELVGCAVELLLLVRIAFALPGDEDSAVMQQRGRQLGEGRETSYCSGGCGIVGLAALARRKLLRAGVDDSRIGNAGCLDRPLHELALASHRLDQIHPRIGQRNREHQPRKPSSRANIRDSLSFSQLTYVEPGEAIFDMHLPRAPGLSDSADRSSLRGKLVEHRLQRRRLRCT